MPDLTEEPVDNPVEQAAPPAQPTIARDQTASEPPPRSPGGLPSWETVRQRFTSAYPSMPEDEMRRTWEGVGHLVDWNARLRDAQETTGSWIYRRSIPVGSAQLNLRNAGYVDTAIQRIASGQGRPEDAEVVAVQDRLADLDRNASQSEQILSGIAKIPAIVGENLGVGRLFRWGGAALGLGRAATGAASTALATGIESGGAVAAGSAVRSGLTQFAQGAAAAPFMPSLYAERAIQNNQEAGRPNTDWRGFPGAMALAGIQNGIFSSIGNLAGSAPTGPGVTDTARRLFAQGIGAMAIQQGMDIGTSAVDDTAREVFGSSWGMNTRYGIIGSLARGEQGEAMKDAITQAMTNFAFMGLHEAANRPSGPPRYDLRGRELPPREPGPGGPPIGPAGPEPVQWLNGQPSPPSEGGGLTVYREGMNATRRFLTDMGGQGRTGPEAAAEMGRVMDLVQTIITTGREQGMTSLEARQRVMDAFPEGPTRDYGLRAVELTSFPERASSGNMRFPLGADQFAPPEQGGRLLEGPQGRPPTFLGQNPDLAPQTLSPTATGEIFGQPGGPLHPQGEVVRPPIPGHADYPELPNPIAHAFADNLPGARVTSRLDMPALVSPIAGGTEVIFNPKENSVHIDIGVNKQGVAPTLDRETMGMMRGLSKFLEGVKEQGTTVEYRAIDYKKAGGQTGSRAKVYAKMLERAGFEKVSESKGEFVWKPKEEQKPTLLQRMAEKGKAAATSTTIKPTVPPLAKPSLDEIQRRVATGQPILMSDWIDAAKLTPLEKHVITRMTEDRTVRPTLEEVGAEPTTLKIGLRSEPYTRERMRQIAENAIGKMGNKNLASKLFSVDEILGKDEASRIVDAAEKGGSIDFATMTANPKEVLAKVRDRIDKLNSEIGQINVNYLKELQKAVKSGATKEQIDELNARIEKEARDAESRLIESGGAGPKTRQRQTETLSPEKLRSQVQSSGSAAPATSPAPANSPAATPTASAPSAPAARAAALGGPAAPSITRMPQAQLEKMADNGRGPAVAVAELSKRKLSQFISDESGHLDLDITRDFVDQYGVQPTTAAIQHLNTVWRQLAGEGSPKTTDANAAAGEALERFNGSEIYARFAAPIFAQKVLGKNDSPEFRQRLGAVLTERSLRWTKKVFNEDALKFSAALQQAISDRDAAQSGERTARADAAMHRKNGMPKAAEAAEAIARTFAKDYKEADARAREASALSAEAIRKRNEVGSIIGKPGSPFATVDEYLAARRSPDIDHAIMLHNRFVVPIMDDAFKRSQGMNPEDPINSRTQITGSPVNLKSAKSGDTDTESVIWIKGEGATAEEGGPGGQRAGRPPNAKLRRNKFSRQRTGSSEGYDIDYAKMVEHSLVYQLKNAAKAEAVRAGVDAGIYKWGKPGQPMAFEGENARWGQEFNDVNPPKGTQADLQGETSLYVHPDQAHEFRRSIEIDEPLKFKTIEKFMGAIMAVNLASTAELTYHAKNQLGFLMRTGFNPVSLFHDIVNVVKGDPKTMDELIELARINTMKSEGFETNNFINKGKYNPLNWGGKLLDLTRKVLLLQGNRAYDRMVKAKLTKGSETGRRNFLNQLGNYNKRSQHKLIKMLRETKIGPFATAGFNYLVQGVRSVLMNPGVKPASMEARLRLRAGMLLRTVAALAVAELINKALWGRIDASDDTPLGAFRVGTSADGRAQYIDLMDLIGLKRGLRVMGLLSLIEGRRKNALPEKIIDKSARDVVTALVHPLAGPGAQFALTVAFGVDASGFHVAEHASQLKHESQAMLNAKAALEHANPAVGTLFGHSQAQKTAGQRAMELAGPFGVRTAPPPRLR